MLSTDRSNLLLNYWNFMTCCISSQCISHITCNQPKIFGQGANAVGDLLTHVHCQNNLILRCASQWFHNRVHNIQQCWHWVSASLSQPVAWRMDMPGYQQLCQYHLVPSWHDHLTDYLHESCNKDSAVSCHKASAVSRYKRLVASSYKNPAVKATQSSYCSFSH